MRQNRSPGGEVSNKNTEQAWFKKFFSSLKLTETRRAVVLNDLVDASSPDIDFFLLIALSSAIATFGLIGDLPVVTIGAQLVAPLIMPILGAAIASMVGLRVLFERSILAILIGSLLSIFLSLILTFLTYRVPLGIYATVPQEVINRTTVSSLDLGIAIVAGAAAAYAIGNPHLDAALPGVALATSLIPPLCTIGFGISFLSPEIIMGAGLLFLTNFVAILCSATLVFALLGFRPRKSTAPKEISRTVIVSAVLLLIVAIPLVFVTWNALRAERLDISSKRLVSESLPSSLQAEIMDFSLISTPSGVEISVTAKMVRAISQSELDALQDDLSKALGEPVSIEFATLPVTRSD